MDLIVKTNFDLSKLNIGDIMNIGLNNASRGIQRLARQNAPVLRWKLKQGIGIERAKTSARVGPRNIPYAVRREFENKAHPDKKFYMQKAHRASRGIVENAFQDAFLIVSKKIKWA